ncbi:MAG: DMT family transporter [Gaiellaceae bacterium]
MRRPELAELMLLATVALWALNFSVSKYILNQGLRPLAYSGIRYAGAAILSALVVLSLEGSLRVRRADLPLVGGMVAVLLANQLSFVYALRYTTAATVALLFGTLPIFTGLISRAVGVEQLSLRFWLGASFSFGGVTLLTLGSNGSVSGNVWGDLLGVAAPATWAAYSVAIAPLMRRYSPVRLSAVFLLAVSVPLLGLGVPQLSHQEFDFGALFWLGFAYAVIGPLVLTNLLWFSAIDRVGPSRASLYANLEPFAAAVIALLLLSESITDLQVVGGLAIAAGLILARRRETGAEPEPAPAE